MNFEHIITPEEIFIKMKSKHTVELVCTICKEHYTKTKKQTMRSFNTRINANMYCSSSCQGKDRTMKNSKEVECKNCSTKIIKTSSELKKSKSGFLFCSQSCAGSFNNKLIPKRTKVIKCTKCDNVVHKNNTLCIDHFEEYNNKIETIKQQTKESTSNSRIRSLNRSWNKDLTLSKCIKCNYDRFVQLAHIKAVKDFSEDALLSEINSPLNVIPLCPTCHWEFDNGYREEFKEILENYINQEEG